MFEINQLAGTLFYSGSNTKWKPELKKNKTFNYLKLKKKIII